MRASDDLRQPGGTARPLAQFVLSGLVAVALLGLVAVEVMRRQGTDEAINDAKEVTRLAGEGLVAPNVNQGLLRGRTEDIKRMDKLVSSIVTGSVVRVKLWNSRGEIVYSDQHRLIGTHYKIAGEERDALEHQTVDAE